MKRKRILAGLLSAVMTFGIMSFSAFAEENVASINDTPYTSLDSAVTNAQTGDTIIVTSDINDMSAVTIDSSKNITIDLNGNKIETALQKEGRHYYAFNNYGTLTLKDSSADGKGTVKSRGIYNYAGGIITIDSGNYYSVDNNGGACVWNEANSTLTINDGYFQAWDRDSTVEPETSVGPGCLNNSGTAYVYGGTFNDYNKRCYAIISTGTITLAPASSKNITVFGVHGALGIDGGIANINGGKYSAENYYALYASGYSVNTSVIVNNGEFNGGTTYNKSVCLEHSEVSDSSCTIEINGGTFDKELYIAVQSNETLDKTKENILVKGGTFGTDVSSFCANGYKTVQNNDNTYGIEERKVAQINDTYYSTLEAAFAAVKENETVTINVLEDSEGNGIIVPVNGNRNITVNFNNHTYNLNGTMVGSSAKTATNGFQLLKGNTITFKNGTLTSAVAKTVIQNYSTLTLDSMNISCTRTRQSGDNEWYYGVGNNNASTLITGNTNILVDPNDGKCLAFDVYADASGYPDGVTVTLDENMTGTITGKVQIWNSGVIEDSNKFNLIVKSGTFNNDIVDSRSSEQKNFKFGAISGGTFANDVSAFCVDGYKAEKNSDGTYGVETIMTWTAETDSGYYMTDSAKTGIMRFIFNVDTNDTITNYGIKYVKAEDLSENIVGVDVSADGNVKSFYGDVAGAPESATGTYYAIGFVTIDGCTFWSNPVSCSINWNRLLDYTAGGVQ